jgi:hypothetical protein
MNWVEQIPKDLSDDCRVWVYQANRILTAGEIEKLQKEGERFVISWTAHGQGLEARVFVMLESFLVIALNQSSPSASGCSIDKSVRWVREMEATLGLSLTDRLKIACLLDGNVILCDLNELSLRILDGTVQADTPVFSAAVTRLGHLRGDWLQPLNRSWAWRHLGLGVGK